MKVKSTNCILYICPISHLECVHLQRLSNNCFCTYSRTFSARYLSESTANLYFLVISRINNVAETFNSNDPFSSKLNFDTSNRLAVILPPFLYATYTTPLTKCTSILARLMHAHIRHAFECTQKPIQSCVIRRHPYAIYIETCRSFKRADAWRRRDRLLFSFHALPPFA